jgi:hypothetical protein
MTLLRKTMSSLALAGLWLAGDLAAQSASSAAFFLATGETAAGGSCQSFVHKLTGTLGCGAPAQRAVSPAFVLLGGFTAGAEAPVTGRPWLAGVAPRFSPMGGGAALTLHGTELDLGPTPAVTIGGQAAVAGARTRDAIQTVLPPQPAPGYLDVVVANLHGTTTLPRGIGILPLVEKVQPARDFEPFDLLYRGTQGDLIVWCVAASAPALGIRLPGFGHAYELDPFNPIILPVTVATDPLGEFRLGVPPVSLAGPIFVQCLAVSFNPGYAPGSFTNFIRL